MLSLVTFIRVYRVHKQYSAKHSVKAGGSRLNGIKGRGSLWYRGGYAHAGLGGEKGMLQ